MNWAMTGGLGMRRVSQWVLTALLVLALAGCLEPPVLPVPEVSIEPANPRNEDDLELLLEDLGDNPAELSWSITWERDGEVQEDLVGAMSVPSGSTSSGEVWTVTAALVLGEAAGPSAGASVTIDGGGDDDDAADDDDVSDDDDAAVPGAGRRLCSVAGTASNGTYISTSCTGPVEAAPGTSSNDVYTVRVNRLAPPPE